MKNIKLAIDADGGDIGPNIFVEALERYTKDYSDVSFEVFSSYDLLLPSNCKLVKCTNIITSDISPFDARAIDDTSMQRAIMSVNKKESDGVISCGNTGAYILLTRDLIKLNVPKAAICVLIPNIEKKYTAMLDLGANISCSTNDLLNFATMGHTLHQVMFNSKPKIGLLNIGTEAIKGNKVTRDAHSQLEQHDNYIGFIEANDILTGIADVIVSDGFSGNIALKSMEGLMKIIKQDIKSMFNSTFLGHIAAFINRKNISKFYSRWSNKQYSGGIILGLNSVAVKAHGSSSSENIYDTIKFTVHMCRSKIVDSICARL